MLCLCALCMMHWRWSRTIYVSWPIFLFLFFVLFPVISTNVCVCVRTTSARSRLAIVFLQHAAMHLMTILLAVNENWPWCVRGLQWASVWVDKFACGQHFHAFLYGDTSTISWCWWWYFSLIGHFVDDDIVSGYVLQISTWYCCWVCSLTNAFQPSKQFVLLQWYCITFFFQYCSVFTYHSSISSD